MRFLKFSMLAMFSAFLLVACNKTESVNRDADNSNSARPPAKLTDDSPTTLGTSAQTANANRATGATAKPEAVEGKREKTSEPQAAKPKPRIDGAAIFVAQKCTICHGIDGRANVKGSPNLGDAEWQKKHSDAEFIAAIKIGKKPMPPYESKLSEAEIKALVVYVRSLAKQQKY